MKIRFPGINIYFLLLLLAATAGCQSEGHKRGKEAATLRLFLESGRGSMDTGTGVPIYRANPIRISVDREPFLTEADLDSASVVDLPGGFGIEAQFNGHGALVLEGVTVAHKGQRIAVQSHFGETRWLAAPMINKRISNGQLTFTPDATREEAERIVRGLSNVVAKIKKKEQGW